MPALLERRIQPYGRPTLPGPFVIPCGNGHDAGGPVGVADQVAVEAVDVAGAAQRVGELVQLLAGAQDAGVAEQAVPGGGGRGAQRGAQGLAQRVRQRAQAAPQARAPEVAVIAAERIERASPASPESATVTSRRAAWQTSTVGARDGSAAKGLHEPPGG